MEINLLTKIFNNLEQDDLSFAYSGSFSDSITVKLIDLARFNIESQGANAGLKNKVSFLMGECYQNIVRHGINTAYNQKKRGKTNVFFLRSIDGNYYITSANQIESDEEADIKSKLDRVNSLSPDELKELQRQVLMSGEITEKGGAGIGIILMARKTGQKLAYYFEKLSKKISLFYLHIKLQQSDISKITKTPDLSMEEMIDLHNVLVNKKILILHKGDFSKETFLPVLKMIEGNLEDKFDRKFASTKLYHISVETLQNISLHGYKRNNVNEGLFTLGKNGEHYVIGTANYIENAEAENLKKRLAQLETMTKQELNKLYRERLKMVIDESNFSIGLGLIDIFRYSHAIKYSISPHGDASLFSLVVEI